MSINNMCRDLARIRMILDDVKHDDPINRYCVTAEEIMEMAYAYRDAMTPGEALYYTGMDMFNIGFLRGMRYAKNQEKKKT